MPGPGLVLGDTTVLSALILTEKTDHKHSLDGGPNRSKSLRCWSSFNLDGSSWCQGLSWLKGTLFLSPLSAEKIMFFWNLGLWLIGQVQSVRLNPCQVFSSLGNCPSSFRSPPHPVPPSQQSTFDTAITFVSRTLSSIVLCLPWGQGPSFIYSSPESSAQSTELQ